MKRTAKMILIAGIATAMAACSTTPRSIPELDAARASVAQVESSPRAGVAPQYIADARQSLDRANQLASKGGDLDDIKYQAEIANKNAQIANEKILATLAREEVEKGKAKRQEVLLEAREREARRQAMQARAAEDRAKSLEAELKDLQAKKTDRGMVLALGDVLFETNKSTLKPGAYETIDRIAEVLKESPDRKVRIEGHTDSTGPDEYNMQLSEQRAMAVQAALMQRGVSGSQISSAGRGEAFPVASNDTAAGRQQNRRVEMIFASQQTRSGTESGGG